MPSHKSRSTEQSLCVQMTIEAVQMADLAPWFVRDGQTPQGPVVDIGPFHIDYNLFKEQSQSFMTRNMTTKKLGALREAVVTFGGVMEAIDFDERGYVVDGRHRLLVYGELVTEGVQLSPIPFQFLRFENESKRQEYAFVKNFARRHLSLKERAACAEKFLLAGSDFTDAHIALKFGIGGSQTVKKIRNRLENLGKIEFLAKRRDSRGSFHVQHKGSDALSNTRKRHTANEARKKRSNAKMQPGDKSGTMRIEDEINKLHESIAAQVHRIGRQNSRRLVELLARLAPTWWTEVGYMAIRPSDVLAMALQPEIGLASLIRDQSKNEDLGFLGQVVTALQGKVVRGFLIKTLEKPNLPRLYYICPSSWTIHGPKEE